MLDRIIYWFQQPADYKGAGDYILLGVLITIVCIVFLIAIFGKKEE